MRGLVLSRPTASFIVLAFLFSYTVGMATLWFAGIAQGGNWVATNYLGRAGVVFGPAFAALVVTAITTGRPGVIRILSQLRPHREDLGWFVLLPSFTVALTVLAYVVTGTPTAAMTSALAGGWRLFVAHYLLQILIMGIGEELGWRGWLLPNILRGRSRAKATLLVAAVWCPWHLPALLRGDWGAPAFTVLIIALSFLFTALWSVAGERVLVIALAHAAVNAPFFYFESALGPERSYSAWLTACMFYGVCAGALVAGTWRWWGARQPARP